MGVMHCTLNTTYPCILTFNFFLIFSAEMHYGTINVQCVTQNIVTSCCMVFKKKKETYKTNYILKAKEHIRGKLNCIGSNYRR